MTFFVELFRRYQAMVKLQRGRCEGCGRIFRDDHPAGQPTCIGSQECAEEAWLARQ